MVYRFINKMFYTSIVSIRELILNSLKNKPKCQTMDNIYGSSINRWTVDGSRQCESMEQRGYKFRVCTRTLS